MIVTIGIDPGKTGAIVVLADGCSPLVAERAPVVGKKKWPLAQSMNALVAPFGASDMSGRRSPLLRMSTQLVELANADSDDDGEDEEFWELLDTIESIITRNPVKAALAALELQSGRGGEAQGSVLTTGVGFGLWLGILTSNMVPVEEVAASRWTRALGCSGVKQELRKAAHVALCQKLLPELDLLPGSTRKPHDGLADAGLLALYAYRQVVGSN